MRCFTPFFRSGREGRNGISYTPYEDDNNVIGMDISKLRTVPRSIGIAGGIEKLRAIRGAINGHYINTLITDIQCAEALISE